MGSHRDWSSYLGAGCDVFPLLQGHGLEHVHLVSLTGILEPRPIFARGLEVAKKIEHPRERLPLPRGLRGSEHGSVTVLLCTHRHTWLACPLLPQDLPWERFSGATPPSGPTGTLSRAPSCRCVHTRAHSYITGSYHRPSVLSLLSLNVVPMSLKLLENSTCVSDLLSAL